MSRTLTIPDELYERLEGEARARGLDNVERLLEEVGRNHLDLGTHTDDVLSEREQEILGMIAAGHSYRVVAATLGVSHVTVRHYVADIFAKLIARSHATSNQPTDVVMRIDDLRARLSAKYGAMPDSTEMLIEDRARR